MANKKRVKALPPVSGGCGTAPFAAYRALDLTIVERRLRGPRPITVANRRLVAVTPATYKRLETLAKEVSEAVGFVVWPCQVAALLVERGIQ